MKCTIVSTCYCVSSQVSIACFMLLSPNAHVHIWTSVRHELQYYATEFASYDTVQDFVFPQCKTVLQVSLSYAYDMLFLQYYKLILNIMFLACFHIGEKNCVAKLQKSS